MRKDLASKPMHDLLPDTGSDSGLDYHQPVSHDSYSNHADREDKEESRPFLRYCGIEYGAEQKGPTD
jgi:hypothetical protein